MKACSHLTPAKANLSFSNGNIPGLPGFPVVGKVPKRTSRERPRSRLLLDRNRMQRRVRDRTLVERSDFGPPGRGKKAKRRRRTMRGRQRSVVFTCRVKHLCFRGSVQDQRVQSQPQPTLTSQLPPDSNPISYSPP